MKKTLLLLVLLMNMVVLAACSNVVALTPATINNSSAVAKSTAVNPPVGTISITAVPEISLDLGNSDTSGEAIFPAKTPPPFAVAAGVLLLDQFTIDATGLTTSWSHTLAPETLSGPGQTQNSYSMPPHIMVGFSGVENNFPQLEQKKYSVSVPQGRIFPVSAAVDLHAPSQFTQEQVTQLETMLREKPQNPAAIPVLPAIEDGQPLETGKINYIDFEGGSGVGFVAYLGPQAESNLVYLFQGLTDDSRHWLSFVWPVESIHPLGDLTNDAIVEWINAANDSDFAPGLMALNQAMASIRIGENVQNEQIASHNIFNVNWEWFGLQDTAVPNNFDVTPSDKYKLILWNDGAFSFQADCNSGRGIYTMNGEQIELDLDTTGLTGCETGSKAQGFVDFLAHATTYLTLDEALFLNLESGSKNMQFLHAGPVSYQQLVDEGRAPSTEELFSATAAPNNSALFNTIWQWEGFIDSVEGYNLIELPQNYKIALQPDGQVQIQADCNHGSGIYSTNSENVSVEIGPLTRTACGEESLGDKFIQYLKAAAVYTRQGDQLWIDLRSNGGTMQFSQSGAIDNPLVNAEKYIPIATDADSIQLNLNGLANTYAWHTAGGSAADLSLGTPAVPAHFFLTFDGEDPQEVLYSGGRRLYIFPLNAYLNISGQQDRKIAEQQVASLQALLEQTESTGVLSGGSLPLLPSFDHAERFSNFEKLNSGVRYMADTAVDPLTLPWADEPYAYVYQGLTPDGQFYVSLIWPFSEEKFDEITAGATGDLSKLDTMVTSLNLID